MADEAGNNSGLTNGRAGGLTSDKGLVNGQKPTDKSEKEEKDSSKFLIFVILLIIIIAAIAAFLLFGPSDDPGDEVVIPEFSTILMPFLGIMTVFILMKNRTKIINKRKKT